MLSSPAAAGGGEQPVVERQANIGVCAGVVRCQLAGMSSLPSSDMGMIKDLLDKSKAAFGGR